MKRYTITNHTLGLTWVSECEDLYKFHANGLPDEYVGAEIIVEDITQEMTDRAAARELKSTQRKAKAKIISDLKGKSMSASDMKNFCETLRDLLLDSESSFAEDLVKILSQSKQ